MMTFVKCLPRCRTRGRVSLMWSCYCSYYYYYREKTGKPGKGVDLLTITQLEVSSHFQRLASVSSSLPRRREGLASASKSNLLESVAWANPWVFGVGLLPPCLGPPLGQAFPPSPQRPCSCSLWMRGLGRRPHGTQPQGGPQASGTLRGGGVLGPDITEQRRWSHSHAGQLGPFQHVQMSQECAELGTTSLLPSPPPAPHPLICLLKLCLRPTPSTLSLSSLPGRLSCPQSLWYLATA